MRTCPCGSAHGVSRRNLLQAPAAYILSRILSSPCRAVSDEHSEKRAPDHSDTGVARAYDAYSGTYDALDGRNATIPRVLGFDRRRQDILAFAQGALLEVACGTGANFAYYAGANRIENITALDESSGMLLRAQETLENMGNAGPVDGGLQTKPVKLVQGSVYHLPFEDETFDTVVDTFSLCVFRQPVVALREMGRVLKRSDTSRILLLEHSLSNSPPIACYQNLTGSAVAAMSKSCFWNQNVPDLCRQAGLVLKSCSYHTGGTVVQVVCHRVD